MKRKQTGSPSAGKAAKNSESGEVTLEFLLVAVAMFIPVIYLIITLFQVQAATFAAEAAVAQAARIMSVHPTASGEQMARDNATLALADQGFSSSEAKLEITCLQGPCPAPASKGNVTIALQVELPVLPALVQDMFSLRIPVRCEHPIAWEAHSA